MPRVEVGQKALGWGGGPGRPPHYAGRYEVRTVTSGFLPNGHRLVDILLIRHIAGSSEFKAGYKIIKAWRNKYISQQADSPHQQALREAHDLREQLDARIQAYKRRFNK
jgi:hypothetical protein